MGGNKVVHFTHDQNLSSSVDDSTSSKWIPSSVPNLPTACLDIPDCGFRKCKSEVIMSCLNCFLGNGMLYRFEYGVSQLAFIAKFRGGTCTIAKSDALESVIHRAMYLLQNGLGNYNLFANNCKDFALYCKTGFLVFGKEPVGGSGQASVIAAPLAAILFWPLRFFHFELGSSTAAIDIGVRNDVIKVKVEYMGLCRCNQRGDKGVDSDAVDVSDT